MKNKHIIIVFLFLIVSVFLTSCQKEVNIDLPEPELRLVVEGWIEQDEYPVVAVTRNSPYFARVDSTTLMNLFVINAQVWVSDGVQEEKLELNFDNIGKGIWPFVCYKGSVLKGEIGKSYDLTIYAEGVTITGTTTIPAPVFLDTIWWDADNLNNPENDSLGYIWGTYADDASLKQYFRIFTFRRTRDKDWVPLFGSVWDDMFFNGVNFTFSMYRGFPSISDTEAIYDDEELFYFKKGDTVDVKIASIDREHYEFWRTVEQEYYMGGNPFVYPVVIRHNVKGAVGVWGGYGSTVYTVVIE